MGITTHFFEESVEGLSLESRVIARKHISDSQTADNIALWIDMLMAEWPHQVVAVVTLQLCVHDCIKQDPSN